MLSRVESEFIETIVASLEKSNTLSDNILFNKFCSVTRTRRPGDEIKFYYKYKLSDVKFTTFHEHPKVTVMFNNNLQMKIAQEKRAVERSMERAIVELKAK